MFEYDHETPKIFLSLMGLWQNTHEFAKKALYCVTHQRGKADIVVEPNGIPNIEKSALFDESTLNLGQEFYSTLAITSSMEAVRLDNPQSRKVLN